MYCEPGTALQPSRDYVCGIAGLWLDHPEDPGPAYCHVHSAVSVIINIAPAFVVTNSDLDPARAAWRKYLSFKILHNNHLLSCYFVVCDRISLEWCLSHITPVRIFGSWCSGGPYWFVPQWESFKSFYEDERKELLDVFVPRQTTRHSHHCSQGRW